MKWSAKPWTLPTQHTLQYFQSTLAGCVFSFQKLCACREWWITSIIAETGQRVFTTAGDRMLITAPHSTVTFSFFFLPFYFRTHTSDMSERFHKGLLAAGLLRAHDCTNQLSEY